ncbi:MAG: hypothetical protein ACREE4_07855 [Stellaceae bacterium]
MAATVHHLHPKPASLAGFLRIGHTWQNKLVALHAAGRLPYRRFVFEAAHIGEQIGLLKLLRSSGFEIVLDPNFAEAAALGRYRGAVSRLPWANPERPWEPTDFRRGRSTDIARLIAECAIRYGVNAVLSPSHLVETVPHQWQTLDQLFCESLREELDKLGGRSIEIDYQLISSATILKDAWQRSQLIAGISDLPIKNIWLRISGFGATATGAGTRHIIESIQQFHEIGRPLVGDNTGGLPGLAALAFGAVAGISHGIAQRESFNAYTWNHPRKGGNNSRRIYILDLDRYFTREQLNSVFQARGGKSKFACNDTSCCSDIDYMLENPYEHFVIQRGRQIENLSNVEETRRIEHFLLSHVDPAVRSARHGVKLKIPDERVRKLVSDSRGRLIRLRDALADLHSFTKPASRSPSLAFRGGGGAISAALGH